MRKGSNGGTGVRVLVLLAMWESDVAIETKHRVNSTKSMISKLEKLNF